MNDKQPTPRAIKLTSETIEVIVSKCKGMNLPPEIDELIDVVTIPGESMDYYFVTDHPGVTPDKPISWVLIPDFMFHEKFRFARDEDKKQLISIIQKD